MKKSVKIIISVVLSTLLAAGLAVLIWWLVTRGDNVTTIVLEDGLGGVRQTAAFTRIRGTGDLFWWFYPSEAASTAVPLVLWLDGVTGLPPSLLANFGMFGPLDFNLNRRNGSWIDEYNLLLVDAPLGTGFSTASSDSSLAHNFDDTTDHLLHVLESFYGVHEEYQSTPLFIFGQGDGAQLALSLTARLVKMANDAQHIPFQHNLKGIALGNPVVSPALALTKLGFYLDEMGYVDPDGRVIIEEFTTELSSLVNNGQVEEAFDKFLTLEDFINEEAGAYAVNMRHIIQKLNDEHTRDFLRSALQLDIDFNAFMDQTIAPALGISATTYDEGRAAALRALRGVYMVPSTNLVEYILETSDLTVTVYNGNLDAISTTPGQLAWVEKLNWSGQGAFMRSPRRTLVVNGLVEGYFRETDRFSFYWINAAGVSVPLDSPTAMKRIMQRITTHG